MTLRIHLIYIFNHSYTYGAETLLIETTEPFLPALI